MNIYVPTSFPLFLFYRAKREKFFSPASRQNHGSHASCPKGGSQLASRPKGRLAELRVEAKSLTGTLPRTWRKKWCPSVSSFIAPPPTRKWRLSVHPGLSRFRSVRGPLAALLPAQLRLRGGPRARGEDEGGVPPRRHPVRHRPPPLFPPHPTPNPPSILYDIGACFPVSSIAPPPSHFQCVIESAPLSGPWRLHCH